MREDGFRIVQPGQNADGRHRPDIHMHGRNASDPWPASRLSGRRRRPQTRATVDSPTRQIDRAGRRERRDRICPRVPGWPRQRVRPRIENVTLAAASGGCFVEADRGAQVTGVHGELEHPRASDSPANRMPPTAELVTSSSAVVATMPRTRSAMTAIDAAGSSPRPAASCRPRSATPAWVAGSASAARK